jgi:hypothetical protein
MGCRAWWEGLGVFGQGTGRKGICMVESCTKARAGRCSGILRAAADGGGSVCC